MSQYKTRCTKAPDFDTDSPEYVLAYGRGKAKLVAVLYKNVDPMCGTDWVVRGTTIRTPKKKQAVEAWHEWAVENYDAAGHEKASGKVKATPAKQPMSGSAVDAVKPKKVGPPSLGKQHRRSKGGPPIFKRSSAPASSRNRPTHPDYNPKHNDVTDGGENPYLADFLSDKGLFERPDGQWTLTPLGALDEVFNWMMANLPFTATLEYPWVRVTKVLQRQFPNDEKYQQTGAE